MTMRFGRGGGQGGGVHVRDVFIFHSLFTIFFTNTCERDRFDKIGAHTPNDKYFIYLINYATIVFIRAKCAFIYVSNDEKCGRALIECLLLILFSVYTLKMLLCFFVDTFIFSVLFINYHHLHNV